MDVLSLSPHLDLEQGELSDYGEDTNIDDSIGGPGPGSSSLQQQQHSSPIRDNNNNSVLDNFLADIHQGVSQEEQDNHDIVDTLAAEAMAEKGPILHASVAKLIGNHLSRDFSRTQQGQEDQLSPGSLVFNKLKTYKVPENVSQLIPCRVNDSVAKALPSGAKKVCTELHMVESALCKAMTAQGLAMEKLIMLKNHLPNSTMNEFNEVFRCLADSVEFSAFSRERVNDSRRSRLLSNLNSNYRHLNSTTQASNGLLFGNDLEAAMRSVESTNRLSQKLSASRQSSTHYSSSFLERGRGRGRQRPRPRDHQYQPYSQNSFQTAHRGSRPFNRNKAK